MKTKLSATLENEINSYFELYYGDYINIGQTDDKEKIKSIQYSYNVFNDIEIGYRFCSPNHFGEPASMYWFVVTL